MTLTCEQSAIVQSAKTVIDVRAVPGCGKTHTAIACVEHYIESGIPKKNILVLSSANSTVKDFEQRLAIPDVRVITIHALGVSIRRTKNAVLSSSESKALLCEAMVQLFKVPKGASVRFSETRKQRAKTLQSLVRHIAAIQAANSRARSSCISLTKLLDTSTSYRALRPHAKFLKIVLRRYRNLKIKRGLLDFDDMVDEKGLPKVIAGFDWTHVIVDEAQDCTQAQARMLVALCKKKGVQAFRSFGDPMQAVYGFSGGGGVDFANLLDGHSMAITTTHRLTKSNAALATYISGKAGQKIRALSNGFKPRFVQCPWNRLGVDVFHQVQRRLKNDPSATVAILARTRAEIRRIDQALRAQGIWADLSNSERASKNILQVLKACNYLAIHKKPKRNAANGLTPCLTCLRGESRKEITGTVKNYLLQAWDSANLEARLGLVIKAYVALQQSKEEGKELRNELRLWLPLARKHDSARVMWNALLAARQARVTLSTIHSAKGREWNHVMVLGVTEGSLPIHYALKDKQKLAEERRVLYVAVSRAKETVRLYHTPTRHPRTGDVLDKVSRYVSEAGELLRWCE